MTSESGSAAVPTAPLASRASDQRADGRLKVFCAASLGMGPASQRCHVLNLSTSGAMIDCPADLGKAMSVNLRMEQFDQIAVVCWRIGSRAGLRFARPLTFSQVRRCF